MRLNWWHDDGQSSVEFALILPLLLIVLFGVIWMGENVLSQVEITSAATQGALWWSENSSATTDQVKQQVIAASSEQPLTSGEISLSVTDANGNPVSGSVQSGDWVTVSIKVPEQDVPTGSILMPVVNGLDRMLGGPGASVTLISVNASSTAQSQ